MSCGSDFLDFAHICFCSKRAITMTKWNHWWCVWPYTVYRAAVYRRTHSVSWSMGTGLKQLGREADNSTLVRRLRMHGAFPPYAFLICTGTVISSPVCNWCLLVTASLIRRCYWCVLPDHLQTRSQNYEKCLLALCHFCPSAWNNSAHTGRFSWKLIFWVFFENLSRK
jgi:hypothetical protein